jgi:hypothetical protein
VLIVTLRDTWYKLVSIKCEDEDDEEGETRYRLYDVIRIRKVMVRDIADTEGIVASTCVIHTYVVS